MALMLKARLNLTLTDTNIKDKNPNRGVLNKRRLLRLLFYYVPYICEAIMPIVIIMAAMMRLWLAFSFRKKAPSNVAKTMFRLLTGRASDTSV